MATGRGIPYSVEQLNGMFIEKEPGVLYWRQNRQGRSHWRPAGCRRQDGYHIIRIDGKQYYRQRIVYYMHTGDQPLRLDYIDSVRGNDNISNLKPVTA